MPEEVECKVEKKANDRRCTYHIKRLLVTKGGEYRFNIPVDEEGLKIHKNDIGPIAQKIILLLSKIEGIEEVIISSYFVEIRKSPIYEWVEIHKQIMKAIQNVLLIKLKQI